MPDIYRLSCLVLEVTLTISFLSVNRQQVFEYSLWLQFFELYGGRVNCCSFSSLTCISGYTSRELNIHLNELLYELSLLASCSISSNSVENWFTSLVVNPYQPCS